MRAARRQLGFTLLELLVSISLTAVILLILMIGLRLAQRAWSRGTDRLVEIERGLAENTAVHVQMGSAILRLLNAQYQQRQLQLVSFAGDSRQVRFLSNYS